MEIRVTEGFLESHNKTDSIYYRIYQPEGTPSAVVFLIHGMGSHSGRYESFARRLCEAGYVAVTYDQAGHGRSVGEKGIYGSFAEKDGDVTLVKDFGSLVSLLRKRYRHLPFFVFAHSLGSFVARAYIAAEPEALSGAIFSGSCERMRPPFLFEYRLKRAVKKSGRQPSKKVEEMMLGDFAAAFPEPGGWVTTNPAAMPKKGEDPFYGRPMCADAFYDMYRLMRYVSGEEWMKSLPGGLPLLFLSGERDPLGGGGEGIRNLVADLLDNTDISEVTYKIYPGEKHELLGSLSEDAVKADILAWLAEKLRDAVALQNTAFFTEQGE